MRSAHSGLWRVIYIARGEQQAQKIEAMLRDAGFMVGARQPGAHTEDIEIKALDSEAEEARMFLMEQGL